MKIAAYCRVSTDKDEQIDSLTHQKEFFITYAQRNGYQLFRLYADEGISGTSLKKREAFKRLLRDAELGLFEMVVVKDISRFARNTVDALQSIRKLKSMGINTLFLTANMDSMGDSEFIVTLFSAMAQEESNNLSKRVKWGKRINAEKGRVPQQVFGYDRRDNFTLEINPVEAQIVRKIFSLYSQQGLGCRTISMTLNRDGDKTKFGGDWNPRGVRRILVNSLYCGVLVNHKYEIADFLTGKQVSIPKEDRFYHQRPEWAIISLEDFQKAQQILDTRRIQYDSGEPFRDCRYSSKHIFSTLIKCAHCGRSFTRKTYTYANTRVYWRCVTNDQYTHQRCSNRVCLNEAELVDYVQQYFSELLEDGDAFADAVLGECFSQLSRVKDRELAKQEIEARREMLLAHKSKYQEMYANDLLTMAELKEQLARIAEEVQAADLDLAQMAQTARIQGQAQEILQCYAKEVQHFLSLDTVTNADMRQVLDHIRVNRDGEIQVILRKPENLVQPDIF